MGLANLDMAAIQLCLYCSPDNFFKIFNQHFFVSIPTYLLKTSDFSQLKKSLETFDIKEELIYKSLNDHFLFIREILTNELAIPKQVNVIADSESSRIQKNYIEAVYYEEALAKYLTNLIIVISPCKKKQIEDCIGTSSLFNKVVEKWLIKNAVIDKKNKMFRSKPAKVEKLKESLKLVKEGKNVENLKGPDFHLHWMDCTIYSDILQGYSEVFGSEMDELLCPDVSASFNHAILKKNKNFVFFIENFLNKILENKSFRKNFSHFKIGFFKMSLTWLGSLQPEDLNSNKVKSLIKKFFSFSENENIVEGRPGNTQTSFIKKANIIMAKIDENAKNREIDSKSMSLEKPLKEIQIKKEKKLKKRRKKQKNKFLKRAGIFLDNLKDEAEILVEEEKNNEREELKCHICFTESKDEKILCRIGQIHFSNVNFLLKLRFYQIAV